jgi:hypothetical protein
MTLFHKVNKLKKHGNFIGCEPVVNGNYESEPEAKNTEQLLKVIE